jgi:hypothetical protein
MEKLRMKLASGSIDHALPLRFAFLYSHGSCGFFDAHRPLRAACA